MPYGGFCNSHILFEFGVGPKILPSICWIHANLQNWVTSKSLLRGEKSVANFKLQYLKVLIKIPKTRHSQVAFIYNPSCAFKMQ